MKLLGRTLAALVVAGCSATPNEPPAVDTSTPLPGPAVVALPAQCGPAGVLYRCNPVDNSGCDGAKGQACDSDTDRGFGCYPPPNTVALGGDCNVDQGPSCAAGLVCANVDDATADGTCAKYCCSSSDCSAGEACTPLDPTFGSLGWCQ